MLTELLTASLLMAALPSAASPDAPRTVAAPIPMSTPHVPVIQGAARDAAATCPAGQREAARAPLSLIDAHVLGWGRLPYAPARSPAADAPAAAHPALAGKDPQACKS